MVISQQNREGPQSHSYTPIPIFPSMSKGKRSGNKERQKEETRRSYLLFVYYLILLFIGILVMYIVNVIFGEISYAVLTFAFFAIFMVWLIIKTSRNNTKVLRSYDYMHSVNKMQPRKIKNTRWKSSLKHQEKARKTKYKAYDKKRYK